MSNNSLIEWTNSTWNPVTGCTKVSEGCENCYAERLSIRLKAMGNPNYKNGFSVTLHENMLDRPMKWKKSRLIFVNSMSDLFHEDVPLSFIKKVFNTMNNAYWHHFQILTKRSKRLEELAHHFNWTKNIWMGVSIENNDVIYRIRDLISTPAKIRFLSVEPLLSSIPDLKLDNINWVIVGGESGPKARPMKGDWVREIRDNCLDNNIPFFFKQWGGTRKKVAGRILDNRTWDEYPDFNMD